MSRIRTPLHVNATPLGLEIRLSSPASVSCLPVAFSMLLQSIHSHSYLVYCNRMLEDEIKVVITVICCAIPGFFGGSKGVNGAILSYHVLVLAPKESIVYSAL